MNQQQKSAILEVARLRKRDYRKKTGLTIVEGLTELRRALKADVKVKVLYWHEETWPEIGDEIAHLPVEKVDTEFFKAIAFGDRIKGVLAIVEQPKRTLKDLDGLDNPFIMVLDGIEKPGNVGTIIRTAFGAGVDAVILCDSRTDVYNHNIVRSSIGSVFHVPCLASSCDELIAYLKQRNIPIYVGTSKASINYTKCDFTKSCAIVVGSEDKGAQPQWYEAADQNIVIPMQGDVGCLNVAASASILMYEVLRQRNDTKTQ